MVHAVSRMRRILIYSSSKTRLHYSLISTSRISSFIYNSPRTASDADTDSRTRDLQRTADRTYRAVAGVWADADDASVAGGGVCSGRAGVLASAVDLVLVCLG